MNPTPVARSIHDQVMRLANRLPAAPQIFSQLNTLLQRPDSSLDDVADLIALDPALAGQVLQTANSVYYRGSHGAGSVKEAIRRLGLVEVHRVVGVAMATQLFFEGASLYRMSGPATWSNAIVGALAMESLARHAGVDTHEAYTLGLLRQVGKLALSRIAHEEKWHLFCPEDVDLLAWERSRFDLTNLEVTADVLSAWKLPTRLVSGVRHSVDLAPPDRVPLAGLLHLSGWIVEQLGHHFPSEYGLWKFTPAVCAQAQVSEALVHSATDETATEWQALKAWVK